MDTYNIQTKFSIRIILLILYMDLGYFIGKEGKYDPRYDKHSFSVTRMIKEITVLG